MSKGMSLEQAKAVAEKMTYMEAIINIHCAKGIAYRKATLIKLHELAEIADRLDRNEELPTMYYPQVDGITPTLIIVDEGKTKIFPCSNCKNHDECCTEEFKCRYEPQAEISTNFEKLLKKLKF